MRPSRSAALAVCGLLLVSAVGCTAAPSEGSSDGADASPDKSPLSEYLDASYSATLSPEQQEVDAEAVWNEYERIVAECMVAEGFEYTPTAYISEDSFKPAPSEEWRPDDREWVAQWGYGITDIPARHSAPDTDANDAGADPNIEYLGTLSEAEQAAYEAAMYGEAIDPAVSDESAVYDPEKAGCTGRAQEELTGDAPDLSEFDPLMEQVYALMDSVAESPEMQELDAAWASCMSDAGESGFTRQGDASQSIVDAMPVPEEPENNADGPASEPTNPMDDPEVAALHEREIELALVDFECRTKTDYVQSALEIQFTLEEQFIEDHKAELEAFKLAAEQAG